MLGWVVIIVGIVLGVATMAFPAFVPLSESWTVRIAGLVALGALPFLLLLFGISGII